jgi:hypothetical protein
MIRRSLFALSTLSALAALAAPAAAQDVSSGPSAGDAAAYGALVSTPVGATVPRLAAPMMYRNPGFGVHADYGQIGDSDYRNRSFVGGLDVPLAHTELSLTAGWNSPSCPSGADCKGNWLAGARWSARLLGMNAGSASPMRFALGVDANLGYAKPKNFADTSTDVAAWSASVGVPVAMTAKMGNMSIAPYVTPGFGWGRLSASYSGTSESESGTRFMMGGGVQLAFPMGLDINAGLQKVFISGGMTVWGGGLSWHGI